jgi:hypothetical protein
MWRLALAIVGVVALASCGAAGTAGGAGGSKAATPSRANVAQAMAAALTFAAHSDPEVAVVDGYVTLPLAVQRGQQPIDPTGGHTNPCAQPPKQPFTARERAALRAAFHDRKVSLTHDPAATLRTRAPGGALACGHPVASRRPARHSDGNQLRAQPPADSGQGALGRTCLAAHRDRRRDELSPRLRCPWSRSHRRHDRASVLGGSSPAPVRGMCAVQAVRGPRRVSPCSGRMFCC